MRTNEAIPGYGHPQHKARDPRVARLFAVAAEVAADGRFVRIAEAIEAVLPEVTGRDLRLNVSAAIPAVLLDVGFPVDALKGVPILARCAGLIGHLTEELARPIGFALSYQATREQPLQGALPPGFTPKTEPLTRGAGGHASDAPAAGSDRAPLDLPSCPESAPSGRRHLRPLRPGLRC